MLGIHTRRRRRSRSVAPSLKPLVEKTRRWLEDRRSTARRALAWLAAKDEDWLRPLVHWLDTHRSIAITGLLLVLTIAAFQPENLRALAGYLAAPETIPRVLLLGLTLLASLGVSVLLSPLVDRLLDRDTASEEVPLLEAELYPTEELAQDPFLAAAPEAREANSIHGGARTTAAPMDLSRHAIQRAERCPKCRGPLALAMRREPGLGLMRVMRCERCSEDRITHSGDLGSALDSAPALDVDLHAAKGEHETAAARYRLVDAVGRPMRETTGTRGPGTADL